MSLAAPHFPHAGLAARLAVALLVITAAVAALVLMTAVVVSTLGPDPGLVHAPGPMPLPSPRPAGGTF